MAVSITPPQELNRRRASRIYEKVDLYYQKISAVSTDDIQALPQSSSQENETLNVNISATGISYTCKEELQVGDTLLLRILLLSSMTVITVSCKVVYCRPSNPFESDRYPYLVGGSFVNVRESDSEVLNQHIQRKTQQRYIFNTTWALLLLVVLLMPELVFELLVQVLELLIEFSTEMAFVLFEIVSLYMDHAVEFVFHTNIHDSQTISFYLLWLMSAAIFYLSSKRIFTFVQNKFYQYRILWYRKKASLLYNWRDKSLKEKIVFISSGLAISMSYLFFFI